MKTYQFLLTSRRTSLLTNCFHYLKFSTIMWTSLVHFGWILNQEAKALFSMYWAAWLSSVVQQGQEHLIKPVFYTCVIDSTVRAWLVYGLDVLKKELVQKEKKTLEIRWKSYEEMKVSAALLENNTISSFLLNFFSLSKMLEGCCDQIEKNANFKKITFMALKKLYRTLIPSCSTSLANWLMMLSTNFGAAMTLSWQWCQGYIFQSYQEKWHHLRWLY